MWCTIHQAAGEIFIPGDNVIILDPEELWVAEGDTVMFDTKSPGVGDVATVCFPQWAFYDWEVFQLSLYKSKV